MPVPEQGAFDALQTVAEAAARLRINPLFALFLGSRELFHSNTQRWLIETCPEAIRLLLPSIEGPSSSQPVRREKHNLDLVIELDRDRIVVENKVKDIPRLQQLTDYAQKIDKKLPRDGKRVHKILLTLVPSSFPLEGGWQELSYGELSQRIDRLPRLAGEAEVFRQCYSRMVADLDAVAAATMRIDAAERTCWFLRADARQAVDCDRLLEAIRLADTFGKHRAAHLRVACLDRIADDGRLALLPRQRTGKVGEIILGDESGMTNKTPFAGLRVSTEIAGKTLALGIQVQDTQYRRFIEWKGLPSLDSEAVKHLMAATDAGQWLFGDFTGGRRLPFANGHFAGKPYRTGMRKSYCAFAPHFVYQYITVRAGDPDCLDPDALLDAMIADLRHAADLLQDAGYRHRYEKIPAS